MSRLTVCSQPLAFLVLGKSCSLTKYQQGQDTLTGLPNSSAAMRKKFEESAGREGAACRRGIPGLVTIRSAKLMAVLQTQPNGEPVAITETPTQEQPDVRILNRNHSDASPAITVIIPNYRKPDLVRRCLQSLRPAVDACSEEVEVVVVDDGSGDGALPALAEAFHWVIFVELRDNRGYAGAVNAGIQASSGRWVFTLNNDTTVEPNVIEHLLRAARSRADVGHLAAQQRFSHDPTRICSAGLVLDRLGVNAERLLAQPLAASERHPVEVFGACGAAAAYRREMLVELGGLDESFVFGLEDADIAWRAQMRGWRCLYVPDAVVLHDYQGTVPFGTRFRFLQAGRNRVRLVIKNADRGTLIRYGPLMILYDLCYVAYTLAVHRTLAPLAGRVEVLRQWRSVRRAGSAGRVPIDLAPIQGVRAALRRRRAWLHR